MNLKRRGDYMLVLLFGSLVVLGGGSLWRWFAG